jgi:5-formyltetrahydrofolate cyclo-ligase
MPDTADPKAALRKIAYARRKTAHETRAATNATQAATAHLMHVLGDVAGKIIAGYMPIRTEIDPRPAMAALCATARLCVPVIKGAGLPLVFREWHPDCALQDGPFGAQIPRQGAWVQPDILIVPLVGFDAECNRLGYGGGFYDRTLQQLRQTKPTRAYGFAYAAQALTTLPTDPTDQPLDAIITQTGVVWGHP